MSNEPQNVTVFPNAPGMVTVVWDHDGEGVYWFQIEMERPAAVWYADLDKRVWTITNLNSGTLYAVRVWAVYENEGLSSDWQQVQTLIAATDVEDPSGGQPEAPETGSPGTKTTPWPALPSGVGCIESLSHLEHVIRHRDGMGVLTTVQTEADRADATFRFRSGRSGHPGTLTFESTSFPGHFLRHRDRRIHLERDDGSPRFALDSTFLPHPKLTGEHGLFQQHRLEAINHPGNFVRHRNFELWLDTDDGSANFRRDSTFRRMPPPLPGVPVGAVSIASFNYPFRFMRHRNGLGEVDQFDLLDFLERLDSTFVARPSLNGASNGISFESLNYPSHYLRHRDWRVHLDPNDGSHQFARDASFAFNINLDYELGIDPSMLEAADPPSHYIRHKGYELWVQPPAEEGTNLDDYRWRLVPARAANR